MKLSSVRFSSLQYDAAQTCSVPVLNRSGKSQEIRGARSDAGAPGLLLMNSRAPVVEAPFGGRALDVILSQAAALPEARLARGIALHTRAAESRKIMSALWLRDRKHLGYRRHPVGG